MCSVNGDEVRRVSDERRGLLVWMKFEKLRVLGLGIGASVKLSRLKLPAAFELQLHHLMSTAVY